MAETPDDLSRERLLSHIAEMNAELVELRQRLRAAEDQSDWMGGSLKTRTRALNERLKELDCVYEVVRALRDAALPPEGRVARVVDLLPRAWLHAGDAYAKAVWRGREYATPGFPEEGAALSELVLASGGKVLGSVEVRYARPHPDAGEGPFLPEERRLLRTVAGCLGAMLADGR